MGILEREEIQTEGRDYLFNKIVAENFLNLKKELSRYRRLSENQTGKIRKETTQIYYN
jgi:hypothetical protein